MPVLRKLLGRCYGYASLIAAAMFISLAPVLFRSPLPQVTPPFHAEPLALLFIAMRELVLLMPPVVAIVSGMAWLTLRKGAPSARQWAIAASISFLTLSAPCLNASVAIVQYHLAGIIELVGMVVLFATFFLLGIAGIFAFGKRTSKHETCLSLTTASAESKKLNTLATTA